MFKELLATAALILITFWLAGEFWNYRLSTRPPVCSPVDGDVTARPPCSSCPAPVVLLVREPVYAYRFDSLCGWIPVKVGEECYYVLAYPNGNLGTYGYFDRYGIYHTVAGR